MKLHALFRLSFLPCLLVALCNAAAADFITGQVVDCDGNGVPGVDIDVKNLGSGGDPPIFNDGTDANGFFTTTLPAGLYEVIFNPPPPPAKALLIGTVDNVAVVGTTNMGIITLECGVALSGTVVDQGSLPVSGVNLDVVDELSGDQVDLVNGKTDAFGKFAIAVPATVLELRFDATSVLFQTLASTSLDLTLTADLDVGEVVLPPGLRLTGTVLDPGGLPVSNADLDVNDSATGIKLYTPKDNTDSFGNFNVVVPAGTFDVDICPQSGSMLVGHIILDLVVSADMPLGVIALQAGIILSGVVRGFDGVPVARADVDVEDSLTGAPVALCGDNADSTGFYSVLVPNGTFDVKFEPPGFSLPYGSQTIAGQTINSPTVLDGTLPSCPFASNYGVGSAGTGGIVPHLTTSGGAPRAGNAAWALELENGRGGALAVLIAGFTGPGNIPFSGGTILVDILSPGVELISVPLSGSAGAAGAGFGTFSFPVTTSAVGLSVWGQFGVLDPGIPFVVALSDGLVVTFCD